MKTAAIKSQHHRKGIFYLVLPFFVMPALLAFSWFFFPAQAEQTLQDQGLNPVLPVARIKAEKESKSSAYEFIAKRKEPANPVELPLYQSSAMEKNLDFTSSLAEEQESLSDRLDLDLEEQESLIQKQLDKIDRILAVKEGKREAENLRIKEGLHTVPTKKASELTELPSPVNGELRDMERMLEALEESSVEPDAQLEQLSQIMDKLLLLQNPGLSREEQAFEPIVVEERVFPALKSHERNQEVDWESGGNEFFGLSEESDLEEKQGKSTAISARIPRTQEVFPGETLEIRLLESIWVDDREIPAGSSLFGRTGISSNRLQVRIEGAVLDGELLKLDLQVYGTDAIPGLEINSGSAYGKIMEDSKSELELASLGMVGMDWQAQVANSGLEMTKGLLKSGSKAKKITIKEGHPVFLINSSTSY